MRLPNEFLVRMQGELGDSFPKFLKSYESPPERGIRVNTLKISVEEFKKISPFLLEPTPWEQNGFYVSCEGLGKTVYHAQGLYYVQEPSAMCAAPKLEVKGGERVLDLCSAPGGKGTQLAQNMCGNGIIFMNEINFSRAKILSSNVERLGIKNAVVTCAPPEKLALEFSEYFDKILVDAPCSGEGMFKKEEAAIPEWSLESVQKCAERQSKILENAFAMLCGGGRMVYSTCTFAPEEDERQIEQFVSKHDCSLLEMKKLYPHEIRGEGHFYAVIEKLSGGRLDLKTVLPSKDKRINLYREWERENLRTSFENLCFVGDTLYSLPNEMPQINVQTLRAGVRLADVSSRVEPSHSLAMCLKAEETNCIDVDEQTAVNFLRGLTFNCDE
ncbi:MAG: RsmF rRNA methyltransferase first C-terminal domain-containing protein, partial [Clostridia bacterium]|nr:RsmF rRNA methyltransferase first C-terminal domain-containing protein [Clostridia bacterium]